MNETPVMLTEKYLNKGIYVFCIILLKLDDIWYIHVISDIDWNVYMTLIV